MKKLLYIVLCLTAAQLVAQAQDPRWELTEPIEEKIEAYTKANINDYTFPAKELQLLEKGDNHGHNELSLEEKQQNILSIKKSRLREAFYNENPEYRSLYISKVETGTNRLQECSNGGFEDGTATGFDFKHRTGMLGFPFLSDMSTNSLDVLAPPTATPNAFNNMVTLVSAGFDPTLENYPNGQAFINRVYAGNRAIKLNSSGGGADATMMSRTMIINEPVLDFRYSFIAFNPDPSGHKPEEGDQPIFMARLRLGNGLGPIVNQFFLQADSTNTLFNKTDDGNNPIVYTDWQCHSFDVSQYNNQEMTIEFIVTDCNQGAHFGTVYIDDVCGGEPCVDPLTGSIDLNDLDLECPEFPISICGTFTLPNNGVLDNISLAINQGGTTITTLNNPTINNSDTTFCFSINEADLTNAPPATGLYTVAATANFSVGTFPYTASDNNSVNIDLTDCQNSCDLGELNARFKWENGVGKIIWNDIGNIYTIEFVSDANCYLNPDQDTRPIVSQSYTLTTNSIDVFNVMQEMDRNKLRWRIKTECSDWTDWCCVIFVGANENEGSMFADCFPSIDCPNGEVSLTSPVDDIISGTTNYVDYTVITATNKVNANSESTYRAGERVRLLPGFKAHAQSKFRAHIMDCIEYTTPLEETRQGKVEEFSPKVRGISVFPNPAETEVSIQISSGKLLKYRLYNMQGQKMLEENNVNLRKTELNLSDLPTGLYFLKVALENGETLTKRVIKK